jgi:hypothetical protein
MPRPSTQVDSGPTKPTRVDLTADAGFVSQGYAMGLGLQVDGEQLAFGARMNVFNLATDDGSPGRDHLSLLSLEPGVVLVSREELRVRLLAGLALELGPVRVRGGYRAIYLDDQGRVDPDGKPNRELFAGPYAGVALFL